MSSALRLLALAVLCLVGVVARVAVAAPPPTVLVVVSASDAVDRAPLELRLRSELITEDAEPVVANPPRTPDLAELQALARRMGATAAIGVVVDTRGVSGTVWVSDPAQPAEVVRRLQVSAGQSDMVAVFSLRAVEAWRGACLELGQIGRSRENAARVAPSPPATAPSQQPASSPPIAGTSAPPASSSAPPPPRTPAVVSGPQKPTESEPTPPQARPATPSPVRAQFGLGAMGLAASDRLGEVLAFDLQAGLGFGDRWVLDLRASGPFVHHIESNVGRARIDQEFALFRLNHIFSLGRGTYLQPWGGLGVSRYGVSADAEPPFEAHQVAAWSLVTGAGVGLGWPRGQTWWLMIDAACLVRWQQPRVEFDGSQVTRSTPFIGTAAVGVGVRL